MDFIEAAIISSQKYYRYLNAHHKGVIEYRVSQINQDTSSIKKNEYWLKLEQKPKLTDALLIGIKTIKKTIEYSSEEIYPAVFDQKQCRLKVVLSNDCLHVFDHRDPADIVVYSDLRFLIRRVEAWYQKHGDLIKLPDGKRIVKEADYSRLSKKPSPDQTEAIEGVLSNPFSYVWGAPGTGKTQFVLARAVLAYIQSGKKVLVTAPTNNAVEQTLYGMIPVLEEAGIDYNRQIVRLGMASTDFRDKYPQICEDSSNSKIIMETKDKIASLELQLNEINDEESIFNEYQKFHQNMVRYQETGQKIALLTKKLKESKTQIDSIQNSLQQVLKTHEAKETELKECENSRKFYHAQAQNALSNLSSPLHKFFLRYKRESEKANADSLLEKERHYEKQCDLLRVEIEKAHHESEQLRNQLISEKTVFEKSVSELANVFKPTSNLFSIAKSIQETSLDNHLKQIENTFKSIGEKLIFEEEKYAFIKHKSPDDFEKKKDQLSDQIKLLEDKISKLELSDSAKNINDCSVVACTIDTCLNRLEKMKFFDHVFLDEAGYSPLIKAVSLTTFGNRMTFLGDHMQLPPVCEVSDRELQTDELRLVALWAQSALYTETVFKDTPERICLAYLSKIMPIPSSQMRKYALNNSFRFGTSLAAVLADEVYNPFFKGNDGCDTTIYYVDAPKLMATKCENQSECDAIEKILQRKKEWRDSTVIIAPYRKQVDLLKQMARKNHFPLDNVLTIHRSQGREWDHVILSVTDTQDMFFTDSLNLRSDGKKIINTAVSRAKKSLVIVCDCAYWTNQKKQLIAKLLSVAKKLE